MLLSWVLNSSGKGAFKPNCIGGAKIILKGRRQGSNGAALGPEIAWVEIYLSTHTTRVRIQSTWLYYNEKELIVLFCYIFFQSFSLQLKCMMWIDHEAKKGQRRNENWRCMQMHMRASRIWYRGFKNSKSLLEDKLYYNFKHSKL